MGEEREEDWSSEAMEDTVDRMVAQFGNNNYLDTTWQVSFNPIIHSRHGGNRSDLTLLQTLIIKNTVDRMVARVWHQ
jgi:hypothetical protein